MFNQSHVTELSTILEFTEPIQNELLDENNLSKFIVDLSISLETRIKAIDMYYNTQGRDNTIETINKLSMMYELSGVKALRNYLFSICEMSSIEPFLKSIAARALWVHNRNDVLAYRALDLVYPKLDETVGTPYRIELVKMLMNNNEYKEKVRDYLCEIIQNQKIDCKYRYKTILSLEYRLDSETKENAEEKELQITRVSYFIRELCIVFLSNEQNDTEYRTLAGQYVLQKCCLSSAELELVEKTLLFIAENIKLEYNIRADATDVLLKLGSESTKKIAQQIIMTLGTGNKKIYNIYDNAQNVHIQEVEASIQNTIEFLQGFEVMKIDGVSITFDTVQNKIMEYSKQCSNEILERIKVALNRIELDRALYSKYSCSLVHILLKIWTFICGHESEDAMKQRLLEELTEMAGTCSSGYASRLINTISGFGDFGIRISWRDQIVANLTGRLNSRIKDMDNLRLQEKILEQMTLENSDFRARRNFLKFLRQNLSSIREEMHSEFKKHIRDCDFDLYFRSAVTMYESGSDI